MNIPLRTRLMIRGLSVMSYVAPSFTGNFYAKKFMTPVKKPRPIQEQELLLTATFEATHQGNRFWVWGEEDKAILLVHGWQGRGSQLGHLVAPLREKGFRVILWDAPAHGSSEGTRSNLVASGTALAHFWASQHGVTGVITHSFGGLTSALALQRGMRIKKLVLIACPSSMQGVFDRFKVFTRLSTRSARDFQLRVEREAGSPISDVEASRLAGSAFLPHALAIHSEDDADVPHTETAGWMKIFPQSRLMLVQKLGHRKILAEAGVIKACVEFCAG
jgi:pimeloyl-ACP methyl ester carboxylesterase